MTTHELRSWPRYFADTVAGIRTYDLRRDDRGFQVGDELLLREYDPDAGAYTGRTHRVRIVHMMRHTEFSGLAPRYVVLGLGKSEGAP